MEDFGLKNVDDLDEAQKKVVEAALEAIKTSYSPYSKFAVGAALLLEDGSIITGSNQENMAYPSGTCAERAALFTYGSKGISSKITKLAVFARFHDSESLAFGAPCGGCRQVMLEYELKQEHPFEVIFLHNNSYVISSSAKALLPFHFQL
ncbi:MAG: cytidine deaminase [Bacteroidetes bacterium]|nr:MAG: cytidine deaminase [Bacteroidota bacterium]